ncbi:MAG: bifunctional demethylmenaquinone methyltransferase/2-methoxy-6-polyprenyl-1,4-benzoquinol methylase UbiE [Planctomycetota bacterium]
MAPVSDQSKISRREPAGAGNGATGAGWSDDELNADPHANAEKARKVKGMFGAIAHAYDLNNHLHSLWMDQLWRAHAVRTAGVQAGDRVLDCACGTGDLTQAFARSPASMVVGADYTHEMLEVARVKRVRQQQPKRDKISYIEADAQNLPFADGAFDVVSIAFGIRNVEEPTRALAEFHRVLRPGGRLVILEFGKPRFAPLRVFNDLYCARIMPATATLIARDRSGAYKYLPKSVGSFMERDEMETEIASVGFSDVKSRALSLGICICYRAVRAAG